MTGRLASPALSENAFDITSALISTEGLIPGDKSPKSSIKSVGHGNATKKAGINDDGTSSDEDFIAGIQTAANRKASNVKSRGIKKGGGFQSMGLNANTLKSIAHKGFSVPTPIQRKTIPLVLAGQDVVGMARTGSGKTAAFVIPMVERLKQHQLQFGARALIMSPSRELALQTLKVVKDLSKNTNLRCALIVGGDRLDDQFQAMKEDFPDVVIATPGRFLHVKIEMDLDLSSYEYVVFDEADRLFEMGFATQLNEILHALPPSRQTLLFSATLPTSLVEFAKAGLQDPNLVRLDSESKISPDLQSAFFTVKSAEKEGALLHILQDVIKVPTGETQAARAASNAEARVGQKRKRSETTKTKESPTEHSTIIFTATKHHVEYIAQLLKASGYAVSYVYGSLDQTARKIQILDFRTGMTNILVVTDVAARGIDIPILGNVINYDFPAQPKIFVHRVGRTARAGQQGWSYSLVKESDCPYLLDLQLFLAKKFVLGRVEGEKASYTDDVVVGGLSRDKVSGCSEWVAKLLDENIDISSLRNVSVKGEKLYQRTRPSASSESARRAKEIVSKDDWAVLHALFTDENDDANTAREAMLARISGFRPQETVFELGNRNTQGEAAIVVKKRRLVMEAQKQKQQAILDQRIDIGEIDSEDDQNVQAETKKNNPGLDNDGDTIFNDNASSTSSLEVTITSTTKPTDPSSTKSEHHMSYTPTNINTHESRGYSVHGTDTPSFLTAAKSAAMNLTTDESSGLTSASRPSLLKWDKRHKKYISTTDSSSNTKKDGTPKTKTIRTESGAKIPSTFRSGRFEEWTKTNRLSKRLPRVGESEPARSGSKASAPSSSSRYNGNPASNTMPSGTRFKHTQIKAPKEADKYRDDFHVRKKRVQEAMENRVGRFAAGGKGKDGRGGGKGEIRDLDAVVREREGKEKRREKTGRHRGGGSTGGRGGGAGSSSRGGGSRGGSTVRGSSRGGG